MPSLVRHALWSSGSKQACAWMLAIFAAGLLLFGCGGEVAADRRSKPARAAWLKQVIKDHEAAHLIAGFGEPGDVRLQVPFTIRDHRYLILRVDFYGRPMHYALCLAGKNAASPIRRLSDLKGRVSISSSREALAFARLLTSPVSYCSWDRNVVEVEMVAACDIGPDFCYGDAESLRCARKSTSGSEGIVGTRQQLSKYGVKPAVVTAVNGGYRVQRTLLQESRSSKRLVTVVEFVDRSGRYRRTVSRSRGVPDSMWSIPLDM